MFDSIGWGEIIVLALAALFIFGPERLPDLAKDAAAGLKQVRAAITGVREQVNESLGDDLPELRDLDLRKYHPKTFIRSQLLEDDDDARGAPRQRLGRRRPRPGPRDHAHAAAVRPRRDVGGRVTPSRLRDGVRAGAPQRLSIPAEAPGRGVVRRTTASAARRVRLGRLLEPLAGCRRSPAGCARGTSPSGRRRR